ncbi:MAG: hypothetical protein ABIM30_08810 [candidate division WOR-3 bacterium]
MEANQGLLNLSAQECLDVNGGDFWEKAIAISYLSNPLLAYNAVAIVAAGAAFYQGYKAGYEIIK